MSTISYGSYYFPEPLPLISESDESILINGKYDHNLTRIQLAGFITGSDLSGITLAKRQMYSGFLNELQTLTIDVGNASHTYDYAKPISVAFSDSNLTTICPYTVDFECYQSKIFSDFFGIQQPVDTWSFSEAENDIVTATHTVSAVGYKIDGQDSLQNAIDFVTGRLNGFENISLYLTGVSGNAFLTSRNQNINRKTNLYSVTETYMYSISDHPISNSGIVTYDSQISYDRNGGLTFDLRGSIQGSFDANLTGGLLTTGNFTPQQATNLAYNLISNTLSNYESGAYSFIRSGPTTYSYNIDTGTNKIDFSFVFSDPDNLDQIGNVINKYTSSISVSKDAGKLQASVNGSFAYNSSLNPLATGDFESSTRFSEVEAAFDLFTGKSGAYNIARKYYSDFTGCAGLEVYGITGNTLLNYNSPEFNITKDPKTQTIQYNYTFDNKIDFSTGLLRNLDISITDTPPITLSQVQETINGFYSQVVSNRTLGRYSISATCDGKESDLNSLKSIVSGLSTGYYVFENSQNIQENKISFTLGKYY